MHSKLYRNLIWIHCHTISNLEWKIVYINVVSLIFWIFVVHKKQQLYIIILSTAICNNKSQFYTLRTKIICNSTEALCNRLRRFPVYTVQICKRYFLVHWSEQHFTYPLYSFSRTSAILTSFRGTVANPCYWYPVSLFTSPGSCETTSVEAMT